MKKIRSGSSTDLWFSLTGPKFMPAWEEYASISRKNEEVTQQLIFFEEDEKVYFSFFSLFNGYFLFTF